MIVAPTNLNMDYIFTEGLDVVDKIEAVGSQSGATAKPVVVKDCGEL